MYVELELLKSPTASERNCGQGLQKIKTNKYSCMKGVNKALFKEKMEKMIVVDFH